MAAKHSTVVPNSMKTCFRSLVVSLMAFSFFPVLQAQTIYQLMPITTFGTHGDGSIRPGELFFDSLFNQRGMAYDPVLTNVIVVDTHTGSGSSDHGVGRIFALDGHTGNYLDDGSGGNFVLNTNGIPTITPSQAYPYGPAVVADDGVVY